MSIWNKITLGAIALLSIALTIFVILWLSTSNDLDLAKSDLKTANSTINSQSAQIASNSFVFERSNQIAREANQYKVGVKNENEKLKVVIRDVLKTESCAASYIPVSVSDRLLDYAYRLHTWPVPSSTVQSAGSNANTYAGRRMTYESAVQYIPVLLGVIESEYSDKGKIRQADNVRVEQSKKLVEAQ